MAAAAGSQESTAATITEAAKRLTPREQRKPEAMFEQEQSTIGLKDAWQVSENQMPSTVAQDVAASSETAGEQQVHQLLGSTALYMLIDMMPDWKVCGLTKSPQNSVLSVGLSNAHCTAFWASAAMQRAYLPLPEQPACHEKTERSPLAMDNAQGQGKGQPFKISPQSASEGPALAQSVASPIKAAPDRPEQLGLPEKTPSPAAQAAVASALSGIKTSPRRSIPVMMAPKLCVAPGQDSVRSTPRQQPTESSAQVQAAGMQAAPALRQLTGQQGQPSAPGIGAQQAGGSPVRAAAKPPVPPLLLAKVPALNAGAAAQRASDAALQSPVGQPVRGDASTKLGAPLPVHSMPRQLPKPIPHRQIAPVAKPVRTLAL